MYTHVYTRVCIYIYIYMYTHVCLFVYTCIPIIISIAQIHASDINTYTLQYFIITKAVSNLQRAVTLRAVLRWATQAPPPPIGYVSRVYT